MKYTPIPFSSFGAGLNLRDKFDVIRDDQAIDLLNVEFTTRGGVRQRDGFVEFTSSPLTNRVDSLTPYYESNGTKQLLAGCGTRLEAINTAGAVVDSETGLAGGPWTFARIATPAAETAYAGNGTDTLRKWDGATWTAPTATVNGVAASAMPEAGSIAVQPWDNRLVATGYNQNLTGGPGGTTSGPSYVHWSNPGLPETWETDGVLPRGRNFVELTPGDGEEIKACVAWRENVFIFKETKFFVVYGTSVESTGTPRFNIRPVDSGIGLMAPQAIAVGRDGVYFLSRRGVYRTTGGEPERVSDAIEPIFVGGPSVYFLSGILNHASHDDCSMAWHNERIYLGYPSGAQTFNDRVLVYDTQLGWWSLWDTPASAMASWRPGDTQELMFGFSTGTNDVAQISTAATNDNGAAITSRWRSGWVDFDRTENKTIREAKLWGTGTITLNITKDYEATGTASQTVAFTGGQDAWGGGGGPDVWGDIGLPDLWGPSNQTVPAMARDISIRGTVFSTEFQNSTLNVTWSITRFAHHLREQRVPSVPATER